MTNYHHQNNIHVYQNACHIDLQAYMKSLKSITLYTQIDQFCDNQSQKLLGLTIFSILRSSIFLELLIFFPLIFKTKEVFCLSSRIINWNLLGFDFTELAWNQLSTFSRSYLRFEKIVRNVLIKLYSVLPSEKLQTSNFITLRNKWLINILKRSSPSIEPCGMPMYMSNEELKDDPILVLCLQWLRQFRINFKLILSRP